MLASRALTAIWPQMALDDFDPYIDSNVSPGFAHIGNSEPIESYYHVAVDPSAQPACCHLAVLVSRFEFVRKTACPEHGESDFGTND
jgi:hypothetical protein